MVKAKFSKWLDGKKQRFVVRKGGGIPNLPLTSCAPFGELFTFLTLTVFLSGANAYTEQSAVEKNKYNDRVKAYNTVTAI